MAQALTAASSTAGRSQASRLPRINRRRLTVVLQTTKTECGLACLAMVLQHHGCHEPLPALRLHVRPGANGVPIRSLLKAASHYALAGRAVRPTLEQLPALRLPAILHWDFNHYVILEAITPRGASIIDPNRGRQSISREELSNRYTGVAIEFWPTSELKPFRNLLRTSLQDLWSRSSGFFASGAAVLGISLAIQALLLLSPLLLSVVIDRAVTYGSVSLLTSIVVTIGVATLFAAAGDVLRRYVILWAGAQLSGQISLNFVNHLLQLPFTFFHDRQLSDVLSRIGSIRALKDIIVEDTVPIIVDGAFSCAALYLVWLLSPLAAGIMLASGAIYAVVRFATYPAIRARAEAAIDHAAAEQGSLMDTLRGIQTVKVLNAESSRLSEWHGQNVRSIQSTRRQQELAASLSGARSAILALDVVVITGLSAAMVLAQDMSLGILFAVLAFRQQFQDRAFLLIDRSFQFRLIRMHLDRLADITLSAPENEDLIGAQVASVVTKGGIQIRGLCFSYSEDAPVVLNDLDLDVAPGEFIAIKGSSGGGKTTLSKILLGLLRPTAGQVHIDGTLLEPAVLRAYRADVAAVLQDDQLFSGTLIDNITCFDPSPDFDRIVSSAKLAEIHDDIFKMPMGYHNQIGDMGASLSGGQKQRVLLARALYQQPRLLILDEGTANLDAEREQRIVQMLGTLGITIICIAHRSATLEAADRVLSLDDGKLTLVARRRTVEVKCEAEAALG